MFYDVTYLIISHFYVNIRKNTLQFHGYYFEFVQLAFTFITSNKNKIPPQNVANVLPILVINERKNKDIFVRENCDKRNE